MWTRVQASSAPNELVVDAVAQVPFPNNKIIIHSIEY